MPAFGNRRFENIKGLGIETVDLSFSFAFNGNSSVSASTIKGYGVSVTLSDTGKYTATFSGGFPEVICAGVTQESITANQIDLALGPISATAGTIVIWAINTAVTSSAAAINVPASTSNKAHVYLKVRRTGAAVGTTGAT